LSEYFIQRKEASGFIDGVKDRDVKQNRFIGTEKFLSQAPLTRD
jgi:hypothetical protein